MAAAVDDDLLPLERGIEVRDDAYAPLAVLGQHERLRRRHCFVPRAERARFELHRCRRIECSACRTGALRAPGGDHGDSARLGLAAKLAAQLAPSACEPNALSRSTGKTIVVACDEPSSSNVCR